MSTRIRSRRTPPRTPRTAWPSIIRTGPSHRASSCTSTRRRRLGGPTLTATGATDRVDARRSEAVLHGRGRPDHGGQRLRVPRRDRRHDRRRRREPWRDVHRPLRVRLAAHGGPRRAVHGTGVSSLAHQTGLQRAPSRQRTRRAGGGHPAARRCPRDADTARDISVSNNLSSSVHSKHSDDDRLADLHRAKRRHPSGWRR